MDEVGLTEKLPPEQVFGTEGMVIVRFGSRSTVKFLVMKQWL